MFEKLMIELALKLLCRILGICDGEGECPDGLCDELVDEVKAIERKVDSPDLRVGAGVSGLPDFIRCLDIPRFVNWIKEGIAIINDAKVCPDEGRLGAAADPISE